MRIRKGEGREGGGEGSKGGNATGTTLDTDEYGYRWRSNPMQSKTTQQQHSFTTESNYTRLRHVEEDWEESPSVELPQREQTQPHSPPPLSMPFNPANSALIAAKSNPAVLGRGDVMWPEFSGGDGGGGGAGGAGKGGGGV
ncbi:hypothetical protein F5876DRAFT_83655 [Lentinula aff. lateritia]|uniref:Uncharacterized protein n=1 Tax=Lentinula aff. lateritia TaxID=2804960 RepID=A0ACC1THG7_9AGAR|nr:hypothetical protein F5876DRAFT_83655 [Lentinula aff. lateritia]